VRYIYYILYINTAPDLRYMLCNIITVITCTSGVEPHNFYFDCFWGRGGGKILIRVPWLLLITFRSELGSSRGGDVNAV